MAHASELHWLVEVLRMIHGRGAQSHTHCREQ
jgi:hypothetical protein